MMWEVSTASCIAPSRVPAGLRGRANHSLAASLGRVRQRRPDVAIIEIKVAVFPGDQSQALAQWHRRWSFQRYWHTRSPDNRAMLRRRLPYPRAFTAR